jgi:hypothetical protein
MAPNRLPKDIDPSEREFWLRHRSALDLLKDGVAGCPHPDLISAASMEVLPADGSAEIRAHIATCRVCSEIEDSFKDSFRTSIEGAPLNELWKRIEAGKSPTPRRARLVWAGLAAAVLVAAGLAIVNLPFGRPPDPQPAVAAAQPEAPVPLLPLSKAELKLPLDSLTWRGSEAEQRLRYLTDLGQAFEYYRQNDFAAAVVGFERLSRQYPNATEPLLYGAVSLLQVDRPQEALQWLELARQTGGSALADDIEWYLAVAHERNARPNEASKILEGLCGRDNPYRRQACDLYPRLRDR